MTMTISPVLFSRSMLTVIKLAFVSCLKRRLVRVIIEDYSVVVLRALIRERAGILIKNVVLKNAIIPGVKPCLVIFCSDKIISDT